MGRVLSAEEREKDCVDVLGPNLGPVFFALSNELTWVHIKWNQFKKLFAHSPERATLLNDTAPFFFRVIQKLLWSDVILHIAKIMDNKRTAGKDNLTLQQLPELVSDSRLKKKIEDHLQVAFKACAFVRDKRNRSLAHFDLLLSTKRPTTPLQIVNASAIDQVLESLRNIMNSIDHRYWKRKTMYDHFISPDDADALCCFLDLGLRDSNKQRCLLMSQCTKN